MGEQKEGRMEGLNGRSEGGIKWVSRGSDSVGEQREGLSG